MASGDMRIISQQKEAAEILRKDGEDKYQTFLAEQGLIDFLNNEEKEYFAKLNEIVYSNEDDVVKNIVNQEDTREALRFGCFQKQSADHEVCTSLEVDGPATNAPETKIVFSPGICKEIVNSIKKSSHSIKIAMFMFTEPSIFKEICNRKRSCPDINVYILVDESQYKEFEEMAKKVIKKDFDNKMIGINVKAITKRGKQAQKKRSGKAHEKFMIVDDSHAITGSFNFTWASEHINYENVIISNDKINIVTPLFNHFKKLTKRVDYEQL